MDLSGATTWWVGVALALVAPVLPADGAAHPHRHGGQEPGTREPAALAVLHAWDRQRARAWAHGDVAALRDLYTAGSVAGSADARLLLRYRSRGLRVRGMRTQVFSLAVLTATPDRLRVRVVDRLAGGAACGADGCVALPRDRADSRTVVLRRAGGRWRVAAVR